MEVVGIFLSVIVFSFFAIAVINTDNKIKEQFKKQQLKKEQLQKDIDDLTDKSTKARYALKLQIQSSEDNLKEAVQKAKANADRDMRLIEKIKNTAIKDFPVISVILADIQALQDLKLENSLRYKKRPAVKAADEVKAIRKEKRELAIKYYACKWELAHLKALLPWIEDIEEEPVAPVTEFVNSDFKENDVAGYWLTPDEYAQLSTVEKYQRALDRYYKRKKTNKEIGTDYERYIGYLYETKGYKVEYFGIEKGMEDLGRDLICINDNEILIIQCKCWSNLQNKVIHEKHINQLYGTTAIYKMKHQNTNKIIRAVFISTVPCTQTAKEFAEYLGVMFMQIPLEKYPMIKCNINKATKEKIYHLPFDQQYDKCSIKQGNGEFYAMTVQEAEQKGFRRAMKWHGR